MDGESGGSLYLLRRLKRIESLLDVSFYWPFTRRTQPSVVKKSWVNITPSRNPNPKVPQILKIPKPKGFCNRERRFLEAWD